MNKSTCIALAVVAISTLREKPERGITRISLAGLAPEEVSGIAIEGPRPVELRKDDGRWQVAGKPADENAVKQLLEAVVQIQSSDLVTKNPLRFAALEVEGEEAIRVRLTADGQTLADFVVGTSSDGGAHVRVDDAVYLVDALRPAVFARARPAWLDRTLFRDEEKEVNKVDVNLQGQQAYTLIRDGENWQLEDPSMMPAGHRFDYRAARSLVSSLVNARAQDILDEDPGVEASGLADETDILTYSVGAKAGETSAHSLRLGAPAPDGGVFARASTRDEIVTVPAYVAGALRKTATDLRDLTLMSLEANAVQRLELVDGTRRLVFERSNQQWRIAESTDEIPGDFEFDAYQVDRRIRMVAGLRAVAEAEGFIAKKTGLEKPAGYISLTLTGGDTAKMVFGAKTTWEDDEALFVRGNADERVYLIRPATRSTVLAGVETFAKREAPPGAPALDPQALQNLPPEVRDSLLRQMAEQEQKQRILEALEARKSAEGEG